MKMQDAFRVNRTKSAIGSFCSAAAPSSRAISFLKGAERKGKYLVLLSEVSGMKVRHLFLHHPYGNNVLLCHGQRLTENVTNKAA